MKEVYLKRSDLFMSIFPWQQHKWQYLLKRKKGSQLPHAILLTGRAGYGKRHFAHNFAAYLLCSGSCDKDEACRACDSCKLLQAESHPDLFIVKPESQGKAIKIDQIRELVADLNNTSHQGGYKVAIIESAEFLNIAAANALLKTLEEPDPSTIIILVTAYPGALPATIRSRCQSLLLEAENTNVVTDWLKKEQPGSDVSLLLTLAEGSPLRALELAQEEMLKTRNEFFKQLDATQMGKISVVEMAEYCLDLGLDNLLTEFMHIIGDLIKLKFMAPNHLVNADKKADLSVLAGRVNAKQLFEFRDFLLEIRRHLSNKINLNQQVVTEGLIISWMQLMAD